MKKLLASILFLALMLSLAACGGGSAPAPAVTETPAPEAPAPAEEPEEAAEEVPFVMGPYGIPVYRSLEDVDLAAVLQANNMKNLLQYLDNFKIVEKLDNESTFSGTEAYTSEGDYRFFLDGEQYVENVDYTSNLSFMNWTQLIEYNLTDPGKCFALQKDANGLTNLPAAAENVEASILPSFSGDYVETGRREADGHYLFTYELKPIENLEENSTAEFKNCSVEIDPETGLIVKYAFSLSVHLESGTTTDTAGNAFETPGGDLTQSVSGEVFYNVEGIEPDYSLLSA